MNFVGNRLTQGFDFFLKSILEMLLLTTDCVSFFK